MAVSQDQMAMIVLHTARHAAAVQAGIHYSQSQSLRWSGIDRHILGPYNFPPYCDCSSFTTWLFWQARFRARATAGTDVVNGLNWRAGYTGTQTNHGTRLSSSLQWVPGRTLLFYGRPNIEHVALYYGSGLVCSHGQESGPVITKWNYRGDFNHARRYTI